MPVNFLDSGSAFLYIAGTIGLAGSRYLMAIRVAKDATMREIQIRHAPGVQKSTRRLPVGLAAFNEFVSWQKDEADSKVTVSPPLMPPIP